MSSLAN